MEHLTRPIAPRSPAERMRAWVEWFGIGRLVASAVATLIVCVGGYWLVKTPAPPTEATLPRATTTTSIGAADPAAAAAADVGATSIPTRIVVHVAGSVLAPGVYELASGSRVRDAVVAAGGPTAAADVNGLNLAAIVIDATRVYVPAIGEEVPANVAAPAAIDAVPVGPVNVNVATAVQLEALPGVGPATAAAIITERDRNGPFLNVDDLERVPGIGPAKLAALRDLVTT